MKHKTVPTIIATLVSAFITGCAKEPPKCSDEATFSLIRQIIVEQLGGREGVSDKELQDNIKIEMPRPSAYDEKIKKYSCEAKLVAGGAIELPIRYESQLDDKNEHVVAIGGISRSDQVSLQVAITDGIRNGRKIEKNVVTPQPKPESNTSAVPSISGTWKGALVGDGEMNIKPTPTGFAVTLGVSSSSGCAGSIEGSALLANNILTLSKKEDDQVCTITVKFSGDTAEVDENNCSYYHGAACGFSGNLNRQK